MNDNDYSLCEVFLSMGVIKNKNQISDYQYIKFILSPNNNQSIEILLS